MWFAFTVRCTTVEFLDSIDSCVFICSRGIKNLKNVAFKTFNDTSWTGIIKRLTATFDPHIYVVSTDLNFAF